MIHSRNRSLVTLTLLAVSGVLLADSRSDAGTLVLSADSDVISGVNGTDNTPLTAGNSTFLANILGGGTTVRVLDSTLGDNAAGINFNGEINSFYNGLSGVTSAIVGGPVTAAYLSGVNLLVVDLPNNVFSASEISAVSNFLAGGGTVFLLGEAAGFAPNQVGYLNSDLIALGSGMRLTVVSNDPGGHTASLANGQVLSAPLTSGVSSLGYAYTAGVTGGTPLFLDSDKTTAFVAVELPTSAAVPEPSSIVLATIAMAMTGALARRRSVIARRPA